MSACLRSASSALEVLRPMQGHSAPPATSTTHQLAAQPRKVRLSFRKRSTDVEKAAQPFWRFAATARNLAAAWLLLAREVPRPTAASARRSEYDSAAAVVGSDRTLTLNVERAGSLASHGKARNRFVTHFNAFTRIAIVSNLVP